MGLELTKHLYHNSWLNFSEKLDSIIHQLWLYGQLHHHFAFIHLFSHKWLHVLQTGSFGWNDFAASPIRDKNFRFWINQTYYDRKWICCFRNCLRTMHDKLSCFNSSEFQQQTTNHHHCYKLFPGFHFVPLTHRSSWNLWTSMAHDVCTTSRRPLFFCSHSKLLDKTNKWLMFQHHSNVRHV